MKCPACNKHELKESAWLPCEDEQHKDYNYYDCANCGPVQKDYVDAVQARVEELEAENKEARALLVAVVGGQTEADKRGYNPIYVYNAIDNIAQWLDTSKGESDE